MTNQSRSLLRRTLIFSLGALLLAAPLWAVPSKQTLLDKYEKAVTKAEELQVYQDDSYKVIPRIRITADALLKGDFETADHTLDEILFDLKLIETRRPAELKSQFKLEWLEIYREVFLKYSMLALLGYFFVKWPFFHRMLKAGRLSVPGRVVLPLLAALIAIIASVFDLTQYGESAWAFFDIQVVLLSISGLLGGVWSGLITGLLVGTFRWTLKPEFIAYLLIAVCSGVLGGFFSRWLPDFKISLKKCFMAGFLIGVWHGLIIYVPVAAMISWLYLVLTVLFLALLEGAGVYIFFAVVSGVLREETKRETEEELLRTKLYFLQAQMSPHFLFNALNTISAICKRENAGQAQNLILKLAQFLRRTLKRADEKIPFREEMDYIEAYLDIEQTRFQDRLKVEKNINLSDRGWQTPVPILILQPLVENAVKHGIGKKESGGTVKIVATDENGDLRVEISDDGVGMKEDWKKYLEKEHVSEEGAGIGLKNIQQRLVQLYGKDYGLEYAGGAGQGTKVTVRIPAKGKP